VLLSDWFSAALQTSRKARRKYGISYRELEVIICGDE
jgi:hypothetical protein